MKSHDPACRNYEAQVSQSRARKSKAVGDKRDIKPAFVRVMEESS